MSHLIALLVCLMQAPVASTQPAQEMRPTLTFQIGEATADMPACLNQFDHVFVSVRVEGPLPDKRRPAPPFDVESLASPVVILTPVGNGEAVRVSLDAKSRETFRGDEATEMLRDGTKLPLFFPPGATWNGELRHLRPALPDGTYEVAVELDGACVKSAPVKLTLGTVTPDQARQQAASSSEGHAWLTYADGPGAHLMLHNETGETIYISTYFGNGEDVNLGKPNDLADMKQPLMALRALQAFRPNGWQNISRGICGTGIITVAVPDGGEADLGAGRPQVAGVYRLALSYLPAKRHGDAVEYHIAASAAIIVPAE